MEAAFGIGAMCRERMETIFRIGHVRGGEGGYIKGTARGHGTIPVSQQAEAKHRAGRAKFRAGTPMGIGLNVEGIPLA
eukprot:scaffold31199_cov87-Isochrysis_galbana.AAC.1